MSDQREIYERDREDPYYEGRHTHRKEGFFERNCDEAWEQVKETFSHPGRLFAKVLLIALLCGVVAGGSYLLKIRAPELPSKDTDSKNNNSEQIDGIDYGDGVRPKAASERARISTPCSSSAATRAAAATPTRCCSRATM